MSGRRVTAAALMVTPGFLQGCQSFRATPVSEIAPESWVRVSAADPFVMHLRFSVDDSDVVSCTVNRLQGRYLTSSGDTLHFRDVSFLVVG